MSGFFDYDNPVLRFIGKLGDVIILNILWVICSIPIVTVGAATTAVYYVTLKMVRDEEGHIIPSFFKSFRENLKQATVIWLLLLAAGMVIGFDIRLFTAAGTISNTIRVLLLSVFIGMGIVYLSVATYVFPVQCRFYNTVRKTFGMALFMLFRHLPRTICMLVLDGGIAYLMFTYAPQLILFGFPLVAFLNSYLLAPVFLKYMPKDTRDGREVMPISAGEED